MPRTSTRSAPRRPGTSQTRRPSASRPLPVALAIPRHPLVRRAPAQVARAKPLLIVLIGLVALGLGLLAVGAVCLVVGAIVFVANRTLGRPARLARELGGVPADPIADARLINVVEGLCVANGIGQPELRVLADGAANAIVLGRTGNDAVLICTTGLLELCDRMEIEGIVAHELAHLKRGDTATGALATEALGLAAALGLATSRALVRLTGPARECCADLDGVAMTRYPPGLASALEKLADTPTRPAGLHPRVARLTAPLWCAPLREAEPVRTVPGLLDLRSRAAALAEL